MLPTLPMHKHPPAISVIMPAYNAQKHIREAIESILAQTFTDFELIIVNDGSSDKTAAIIKSFQAKDKRIRMVQNTGTHNIAEVLNCGIGFARSNIIARMDADDISEPLRLELQYALLTGSARLAVVGADIIIIDSSGRHLDTRMYPYTNLKLKRCLFRYSPFAHPVVMFRKDRFEAAGGYNPEFSPTEDLDLWFRMGVANEFGSIPKLLLQYRISESSASHSIMKRLEQLVFRIRIVAIRKYGYRPSVYDVVYNFFQFATLWITPIKMRIALYNLLRNNNLI